MTLRPHACLNVINTNVLSDIDVSPFGIRLGGALLVVRTATAVLPAPSQIHSDTKGLHTELLIQ